MEKTDRQIKQAATKAEHKRVYDNMNLPPQDIYADCSDGRWVRRAWQSVGKFGWEKWVRDTD